MPSSQENYTPITIAGGGIVGLALAMSIQKQLGVTPEIYEKTSTFATEAGAGLGMYPNGLRVLRDIDEELLQMVREVGQPYEKRHWERHDGKIMAAADEAVLSAGDKDLDSLGIRRSSLEKVLYKYAQKLGISIQFQKPLTEVTERDDGLIEIKFGDGTSRLTQVLFGADGAHGQARSIVCGNDAPALSYTGTTCFMGLADIPFSGISFPSSNIEDFHAVLFPTGPNETCFQFHMPVEEKDANPLNWGNLSEEVGQEKCKEIAARLRKEGWAEKFVEPLEHCIKAVNVGFALLEPKLEKWVKGRVVLVGDAAHPPVPYVGQGAQQGLEDAGVAVALLKLYCMADGKFDPANFSKAMTVYQQIRTKRSAQILDISKRLGAMQSRRSGEGKTAQDEVLKGEVLMYGTLPIMSQGADHDYKEDILTATTKNNLPEIDTEAALDALDYILGNKNRKTETDLDTESESESEDEQPVEEKRQLEERKKQVDASYAMSRNRVTLLCDWIFEILERNLRQIIAHRNSKANRRADKPADEDSFNLSDHPAVDELSEIIPIPLETERLEEDPDSILLSAEVEMELMDFIEHIASLYNNNPFHNFEHAAQVTMNVYKLLSRMNSGKNRASLTLNDQEYKDQAYGISTDPLTKFALLYSALLHDADHEGVPNTQMEKEKPEMAKLYKGHAFAEQHSIDVAWEYFMLPKNSELRRAIYADEDEMRRFRKLVVNIVLATDICDKDLREFRNSRIEKATSLVKNLDELKELVSEETMKHFVHENAQRKATIGVEYIIQASDICHTMSPWRAYRQWNRRLYHEMYRAFREGRSEKDPSVFWYQGEIAFFDFYIIPLAKKLKNFEVFGAVCDEFIAYAEHNREEWKAKGEDIVNEYIHEVEEQWSKPLDI